MVFCKTICILYKTKSLLSRRARAESDITEHVSDFRDKRKDGFIMTEKQQKAIELHGKGYNCFQSVACVFAPELDVDEVTAFRMGEGFGLGMGDMSQTCGAITGAVACMGLLNSAGDLDAPNTTKRATMGLASTLTARFLAEHGSCICQVLKGRTGCPVVPCDTCIADCVGYVEEELKNRV